MYTVSSLEGIFWRAPIRTEVISPLANSRFTVESETQSQSAASRKVRKGGLGRGSGLGVTGFGAAESSESDSSGSRREISSRLDVVKLRLSRIGIGSSRILSGGRCLISYLF